MKKKTLLILLVMLMFWLEVWSADRERERSGVILKRGDNFFKEVYLEGTLEVFLENRVDFGTVQNETVGGLSESERYVFSLRGGGYVWNQFFYQGFNITDSLISGSSLYKLFLFDKRLEINGSKGHFSIEDDFLGGSEWRIEGQVSPFGERFFLADAWTRELGGYSSVYEREGNLLKDEGKRRGRVPFSFSGMVRKVLKRGGEERNEAGGGNGRGRGNNSVSVFEMSYLEMRRELREIDFRGEEGRYESGFRRLGGRFEKKWTSGVGEGASEWHLGQLFLVSENDNFDSYLGLDKREGRRLGGGTWSSFLKGKKGGWEGTGGVNVSYKRFEGQVGGEGGVSYNVFDLGGERVGSFLSPLYEGVSVSVPLKVELDLEGKGWMRGTKIVLDSKDDFIFTFPVVRRRTHGVYFETEEERFSLYARREVLRESESWLSHRSLGIKGFMDWFKDRFFMSAWEVAMEGSGFIIRGEERLFFMNASFELKNSFNFSDIFEIEIDIGKKNIGLESKTMLFFSDSFSSSESYYWADKNDNQRVEEGEVSEKVFDTSGGRWHRLREDLRQPYLLYLELPLRVRASEAIGFEWGFSYRSFRDLYWVSYKEDEREVGFFETDEEGREWYFLKEGEKVYEVGNFNLNEGLLKERVSEEEWPRGHFFLEHPFYLSMRLGLDYEKEDIRAGISFTAFLVMMINSRGNGVGYQSLGLLSEQTANPNGYRFSAGRGDADRGYFMKAYYYHKINSHFSSSWTLKYRDGQPFGVSESRVKETALVGGGKGRQVSFQRSNVHGDNIFNGKFGRREDSHWDLSGRFRVYFFKSKKKNLSFFFSVENLLDLGSAILEDTLREEGKKNRLALKVEPPRSVSVGLEGTF